MYFCIVRVFISEFRIISVISAFKVPLSHSSCVKVLYDRHMEVRTDQNNNNGADVDVTTVPTNFAGNLKMAKEHQNKAQTDTSFGANLNDTEVRAINNTCILIISASELI
jgi:hypothetical protein